MSRKSRLDIRVQPRANSEEEDNLAPQDLQNASDEGELSFVEDVSATKDDSESEDGLESGASREHSQSAETTDTEESDEPEAEESIKDISFGALAQAAATLAPKSRKRKLDDVEVIAAPQYDSGRPYTKPEEGNTKRFKPPTRTSKHAPTVLSSSRPVSRKREIFEPPAIPKARDPRFDPTITASTYSQNATSKANKAYSFLTTYQATEILDLKSQIKKAKDPDTVSDLKRQLMSIESKLRLAEHKQREADILKRHKDAEREKIKTGEKQRPYYIKAGEVRKEAKKERLEGMGKKARDKAEERKRKREKGKESKGMPRFRRERVES